MPHLNRFRRLRLTAFLLALLVSALARAGAVDDFENSWTARALALQRALDADQPLAQAFFPGTHNSYNSKAYQNATRYLDPNQHYSLTDQLRMGIRALELDVHYTFKIDGWPWNWGNRLLLCHGQDNHVGCSPADRYFRDGVAEIARWLDRNPSEVILLYIEDHMDGRYGDAIRTLSQAFGQRIFRPSGNGCQGIPMQISKTDILRAGKQVLIMTDGCRNTEWNRWVFGGFGDYLNGYPTGEVADLGTCLASRFSRAFFDSHIVRVYEDRTRLSATFGDPGDPLTPAALARAVQCGVNMPGMDMLSPGDGRLDAAVWSWQPGEPNDWAGQEDCAESLGNGRFNDLNCGGFRPFACQRPGTHDWYVTRQSAPWQEGDALCAAETGGQYRFAVPRNAWDNENLKAVKALLGAERVWLNYSDRITEGQWQAGF